MIIIIISMKYNIKLNEEKGLNNDEILKLKEYIINI